MRTALHGAIFGALLETLFVWHYFTGTDDRYYVGFLAVPYCALPGFVAGLRSRTIGSGAVAGTLTAVTGSAIALVVSIALTRNTHLLINSFFLITAAILGWMFGAAGGIVALVCSSWAASLGIRNK